AAYQQRHGGCPGVVGTLMSNFGLELGLKELNVPFARAKVGDRYVIETMRERSWILGGESSGHIVCGHVTTTGDGIVAALQVLLAICSQDQTLYEAKLGMNKLPQTMINVHRVKALDLAADQSIQQAISHTEATLAGRGRVLL